MDLHQKSPFHSEISRLCRLISAFASSPTELAVKTVNLADCVQVAKLATPKLFKREPQERVYSRSGSELDFLNILWGLGTEW